jgi:hemerythrin
MTLFSWDSKYTVNIGEIDRQHRKLFELFNELYEAMQQGHGDEVTARVLALVVDYTYYHFAYEEQLLREYGYAEEKAHRTEHAKLTEQAMALTRKLQGGQSDVALGTLKFLCDWLNNHILGSDRKFAPFLIGKGVR